MSERTPYSRVYHAIVDDPKFASIYDDDRRLATWLRLLIVAEQAHPASANIPAGTHRASVKALVDAGLLDLGTGSRYRIHGLDAERERRSEAGRVGGLASGRSRVVERSSNGRSRSEGTKSNLDEHRRDETSKAEQSAREDALSTYWTLMGSYPAGRTKTWIEELVNEFDDARVSAAIAAEAKGDRQGLLGRTRDRLRSDADRAEKARAQAHTERLEAEAAAKRITPEQAERNRKAVNAELTKMLGRPS